MKTRHTKNLSPLAGETESFCGGAHSATAGEGAFSWDSEIPAIIHPAPRPLSPAEPGELARLAMQLRGLLAERPDYQGLDLDGLAALLEADGADAAQARRAARRVLATRGAVDGYAALRDDPPPHRPVLAGLFDWLSLVEIVGPSKVRKSFFVFMLALLLAAGRRAFGFDVAQTFSVCIADLELSMDDIRRRLWRMGQALGIGPDDIGDRLLILPLAGVEHPRARIEAAAAGFDVLIVDPLYALCDGGEGIEDLRDPLRWLRREAVKRAAAVFVHHDAKGSAGDRQTRDRGSGSGITGRAVDARITLTPAAADHESTVVAGFMCRSYVAPPPSAWVFEGDAFHPSDLPAEPERNSDQRARAARPKLAGYHDAAMRILRTDGPMSPAVFKRRLRDEMNATKTDADDLTKQLCEPSGPAVRWREGGFATAWKIGTREQAPTSRLLSEKKQEEGEEG